MRCSKCGREIPNNIKFCRYCGTKVKTGNPIGSIPDEGRNRSIVKIIVIIVSAVLVTALIAGLIYWQMSKEDETQSSPSNGVKTVALEEKYTVEEGRMYLPVPEVTYENGDSGIPENYTVYINGEECPVESGYVVMPDNFSDDTCDLRLEWEEGGETYSYETELSVEPGTAENWKDALIEYVQNDSDIENQQGYCLIYLDDDNIPELVEVGIGEATGARLINYDNGTTSLTQLWRLGFTYIERGNLLNNANGNMGYYYDRIFSIVDGQMQEIATGKYYDESGEYIYEYEWNGEPVSEDEYYQNLNSVYDEDKAVEGFYSDDLLSAEEIVEEIESVYEESREMEERDRKGAEFARYFSNALVGTWKNTEKALFDKRIEFYEDGTYYCDDKGGFEGDHEYWGTWEVTSQDGDVYFDSEVTKLVPESKGRTFEFSRIIINYEDIDKVRAEIRDGKYDFEGCRKAE